MKKMFLCVSLLLSSQSMAAGYTEIPINIVEIGITKAAGGYVFANIDPAEDVSTCANHNQVRFEMSGEIEKGWLSTLLTAKASGKPVKFYFNDNDCLGDGPRPFTIVVLE